MDSCTECWVLLMMSSTGNDVWGAVLYFSVCVCVCVCVCRCFCLHSTADAWAVVSAIDPHLAFIRSYPSLPVVYCRVPEVIVYHPPCTFRVKLDSWTASCPSLTRHVYVPPSLLVSTLRTILSP